jgi:uncharacterized phiE125 gp8 family phage protein
MQQDDHYKITVAPTSDLITSIAAKDFIKDVPNEDDALIEEAITALAGAEGMIEDEINRVIMPTTFTGYFANLVETHLEAYPFIQIRRAPLSSIVSVKGMVDSVLTDIPTTDYYLKETSTYARILFTTAPSVDSNIAYPLEVNFIAGYSTVPKKINIALKQWINFMYENRGDVVPEGKIAMPIIVKDTLSKLRIINTFG